MPRMQRPLDPARGDARAPARLVPAGRCAKRKVPRGFYGGDVGPRRHGRARRRAGGAVGADGAQRRRVGAHRLQLGARAARAGRDRLQPTPTGSSASPRATASSWCRSCAPRRPGRSSTRTPSARRRRNPSDYAAFLTALIGALRPERLLLGRAPRAAQAAGAHLADLERAPPEPLVEHRRALAERLGARVRGAAEGGEGGDRRGRPGRDGRARRPGRLRLAAPDPAQPLQDRPLLRRGGDQPVHGAPAAT